MKIKHLGKASNQDYLLCKHGLKYLNQSHNRFFEGLRTGVNIAQLFSKYGDTPYSSYSNFTTALSNNVLSDIWAAGFTHIRIPITRTTLTTDLKNTARTLSGHNMMQELKNYILAAQDIGLRVIVSLLHPQTSGDPDYNITTRLLNNSGTDRNDVTTFCTYVVNFLLNDIHKDFVAFEIINEPHFYNQSTLRTVYLQINNAISEIAPEYSVILHLDGYSRPPEVTDGSIRTNSFSGFSNHIYGNYSEPGFASRSSSLFALQGSNSSLIYHELEWPPDKSNVNWILANYTLSSEVQNRLTNYIGEGPDNFDSIVNNDDLYMELNKFHAWAMHEPKIITEVGCTSYAQAHGGDTWLNTIIYKAQELSIPVTIWSWHGDIFDASGLLGVLAR
jgi:aryl-phospho-beta-D-glucosidase BglC (GH1 family)